MTAQERSALGTQPVLGAVLFAFGTALFLSKLAFLLASASTELIGAIPAIGMAILKASTTVAFAGNGLFAVVLGVLVSFWPLLLIAAGSGLLIQSQVVARNRRAGARG